MADNDPVFTSATEHRAWLQQQAALTQGFRVGTHTFDFTAGETGQPARMTATLIALDEPTPHFAAVFTKNAFPGAPVIIGRQRLQHATCGAIVINNKISNVCAPDGVATSEAICAQVGECLNIPATAVIPSSTGIIGWQLPKTELCAAIPAATAALQTTSILPAADGIVTTDLYAKVRRFDVPGGGSIVGIAKGAGMIEPNMATMLVYILTDISIERQTLRQHLSKAVDSSFNCISVDSDTSTSDTVALLSSNRITGVSNDTFATGLQAVCDALAEDVVRNGEGVQHVQRVTVQGAPNPTVAKTIGRAVINSPLWKTALAGNDPNVGRLVCAVGKDLGRFHTEVDPSRISMQLGGVNIFKDGAFLLDPQREAELSQYLQQQQLYASQRPETGTHFAPPVSYPPHAGRVEINIDLHQGEAACTVIGNDLTHEYISENADYRS